MEHVLEDGTVLGLRGEYLHFRCDRHKVDGFHVSGQANYCCQIKGCDRPATAYWYRGDKFQKLPNPDAITLGEWTP